MDEHIRQIAERLKGLRDALDLGSASSRFNLLSPTASDGAVSLSTMRNYLQKCDFTPIPEAFR